jgi:phosphoserine phosphatase
MLQHIRHIRVLSQAYVCPIPEVQCIMSACHAAASTRTVLQVLMPWEAASDLRQAESSTLRGITYKKVADDARSEVSKLMKQAAQQVRWLHQSRHACVHITSSL